MRPAHSSAYRGGGYPILQTASWRHWSILPIYAHNLLHESHKRLRVFMNSAASSGAFYPYMPVPGDRLPERPKRLSPVPNRLPFWLERLSASSIRLVTGPAVRGRGIRPFGQMRLSGRPAKVGQLMKFQPPCTTCRGPAAPGSCDWPRPIRAGSGRGNFPA